MIYAKKFGLPAHRLQILFQIPGLPYIKLVYFAIQDNLTNDNSMDKSTRIKAGAEFNLNFRPTTLALARPFS